MKETQMAKDQSKICSCKKNNVIKFIILIGLFICLYILLNAAITKLISLVKLWITKINDVSTSISKLEDKISLLGTWKL